jgi:hypothetical protein
MYAIAVTSVVLQASPSLGATVTWVGEYYLDNRWLRSTQPDQNPQWNNNNGPSSGDGVLINSFGGSQTLVNNNYTLSSFTFDFDTGSAFLLGNASYVLTFNHAIIGLVHCHAIKLG